MISANKIQDPKKFVHLHTHSHYSLLDGLAKIDDLIKQAQDLGMTSLALTDHGNLYGAIEFYQKATKAGLKPILGVEAYLAPISRFDKNPSSKYHHQLLLVENEIGWKNLLKLVTKSNLEGFYYKPRLDKELLRQFQGGLIATSSCLAGEIPQTILQDRAEDAAKLINEYKQIFGEDNFFLELQHHPNINEQTQVNAVIKELAKNTNTPLIASQDIHYAKPEDAEYHDILLAVQTGNKLSDTDRMTLKMDNFSMTSPKEIAQNFADTPEVISNTANIAARCNIELSMGKPLLPEFPLPEGFNTDYEYFEHLTRAKLKDRYPNPDQTVYDRLEYELKVIKQTGYAGYFLIVQDFINWAKTRGIAVGPGRGSAAGSLISYVLNITDLDPLAYDLLFERFLNPERVQMPDIDIDIADTRRDEVIAYVRDKYGTDHVAQIITFGTMAARAAIRDSGRALGISYSFCDQIAKLIPFNFKLPKALKEVSELRELYESSEDAKKVIDAAIHLEGVARHASVHACGTVISPKPLTEYLPLQRSPQDDQVIVTQFEMHAVEDLGLLKMDFLGLKNLTIIEETQKLVRDYLNETVDVTKIPLDDPETFKLLQAGDNTGVFQFESSGMRRYMRELKPTDFEDLIAMVSLYRPGPIELLPSFIKRKHGEEKVTYLHPNLEPILKNTYGIGVYQEQMMRIARDLAGYSLAEADTLRKAIGKKIKELLDEQKEKLISGMIKKGIDKKIATQIWELFPPFARYGFNRSHAACYALIGYRTAYLKAHYPVEFYTSLLNSDSRDIDRLSFLTAEAAKADINVLPPDINKSDARFSPDGDQIRFGLAAVKNVGANIVNAIIEERSRGGPFQTPADFLSRVKHKDVNKKSMESLIKAGAFDSLDLERGQALHNIELITKFALGHRQNGQNGNHSLFGNRPVGNGHLRLEPAPPATPQEKLTWEKELLGLYISAHPLDHHQETLTKYKVIPISKALLVKNERDPVRIAGVINTLKRHTTKRGEPMFFASIVDKSGSLEALVFSDVISKKPTVWKENTVIIAEGNISLKNDDIKFICQRVMELK